LGGGGERRLLSQTGAGNRAYKIGAVTNMIRKRLGEIAMSKLA